MDINIEVIQQAARETLERHSESFESFGVNWCVCCNKRSPCPDRVAAERIVHAAATLAATHEKIREHAENGHEAMVLLRDDSKPGGYEWNMARIARDDLKAILGLLSEKPTEPEETKP